MTTNNVLDIPTEHDVEILIAGSGFAGLGIAAALKRSGREDFVIIERAGDVGGTWRDNRYPGAACDVPSHLYSFSFRPNPQWSRVFSPQAEIFGYLRETAREEGLLPHVKFHEELLQAEWIESDNSWRVRTSSSVYRARVLITATGHLSDPKMPAIEGLDGFTGTLFHSATWDESIDLAGKRVGVVGSGASAIQIIPELQKTAEKLVVFQRSAAYVTPRHDRSYSEAEKRAFKRAPRLISQMRSELFWANEARFVERQAVPRLLDEVTKVALDHLAAQVTDPQLRAALTPNYRIGCKRILKSNDFYPALQQDNVHLDTRGIARIEGSDIVLADGSRHELDVLVMATGFEASDLPIAHRVVGVDDTLLADQWKSGMQAYATTSVHNFPNLFIMNGPNSGLGHNSIIYIIETQVEYIMGALDHMDAEHVEVIEVTAEAEEAYAADLDARSQGTVWLTGGCENWYVDPRNGRLTTVWPDFAHTFREENAVFVASPYVLTPKMSAVAAT
ncbi:cation diffusion facilitator CzcD-associated flavoprotein CzcO [Mycetocola sp. 2940]